MAAKNCDYDCLSVCLSVRHLFALSSVQPSIHPSVRTYICPSVHPVSLPIQKMLFSLKIKWKENYHFQPVAFRFRDSFCRSKIGLVLQKILSWCGRCVLKRTNLRLLINGPNKLIINNFGLNWNFRSPLIFFIFLTQILHWETHFFYFFKSFKNSSFCMRIVHLGLR